KESSNIDDMFTSDSYDEDDLLECASSSNHSLNQLSDFENFTYAPMRETSIERSRRGTGDNFYSLVDLQNFDGSFDLTNAFATLIGLSLNDLQNFGSTLDMPNNWIATCIAIAYMELKFQSRKAEWELLSSK